VRLVDLLDLAARELVEGICESLVLLPRQPCLGNKPVLIASTSPDRAERAGQIRPIERYNSVISLEEDIGKRSGGRLVMERNARFARSGRATEERPLRDKEGRILSVKAALALAVMLASLPALASCGVNARSGDGSQPAGARTVAEETAGQRTVQEPVSGRGAAARAGDARARAGDAVARAGAGAVARAGDVEARAKDDEETKSTDADSEDPSRKVTLEIRGERGTRFSGTCSIGSEERRIGGRAPESYSYEPGGEKLECEIRKDGPGALEVVLASGTDVRSVQRQTGVGTGIISLSYSGDGAAGVSSSGS